MAGFLFVPHHRRPEAVALVRDTLEWLGRSGHQAFVLEEDARACGLGEWSVSSPEDLPIDLAVSVGGDGTMLRTLDLMCRWGLPVLGVNVGHLGYLTEVEPQDVRTAIEGFLAGKHHVEERMMIEVDASSESRAEGGAVTLTLAHRFAVNDVVVEKVASGHTARLEAVINGKPFLSYAVDAMIVATPTGSTAYNFSARGPVLSPTLEALLMTPVSAHMLFDRPLVLDGHEELELRVIGREDAAVVVDGLHVATLGPGGSVICRKGKNPARLVTFAERDFREILKVKFGLANR